MAVRRGTRGLLVALAASVAVSLFGGAPVAAAAEPSGFEFYKTYAETEAIIDAAVANAPDIARKLSIGQSAEGRPIWAIEITADIAQGEQGKPEVVIDGLTQARERASAELAVYMIKVLTNNYGRDTKLGRRVTGILDSTVVWIIPMLNPDGAEYDFSGGTFHDWSKNRQPLPGTGEIGIDIGRNFGFAWGCCAADGSNPASATYRGPEPWSAPEAVAYRNFVSSRGAGGTQRVTETLSLHSGGKKVLWPMAHTSDNLTDVMTADDRAAFAALAKGITNRNNYARMQHGDVTIDDGDPGDWAYYQAGIFALTLDMRKGANRRYYPTLSELNKDLVRNRSAVLWFLEQAGCPYRAAGLADQHCTQTASAPPYAQSVYRSSAAQAQQAGCWCAVASAQTWLRHIDESNVVSQNQLDMYMREADKNDWTDPSTDYYIRCTRGSPSPSFAHDGRGMAWTMYQYASVDGSLGFNDYGSTSRSDMNWQIVRSIRASGMPVGVIAAAGRHAILAVGYSTDSDPLDTGTNSILGMRVWDPWYQSGFGSFSGWPTGGFAPNSYVALNTWNSKYFTADNNEGPYYAGKYVAILPTSVYGPPSDNPVPSLGQAAWEEAQAAQAAQGAPAMTAKSAPAATSATQPTLAAAIEDGLRANALFNDASLGNVPESYTLGRSVSVESVAGELPYQLVELVSGWRVRAVALVESTADGYEFGELRPVTGLFHLPSLTEMRATLDANDLEGTPRLVWDWTSERNGPFAPFLAGRDPSSGDLSILTRWGTLDLGEFLDKVRADN
ncbi:MAG: M14 family zinc carboxypeptidase [Chloroflexota bacterium]